MFRQLLACMVVVALGGCSTKPTGDTASAVQLKPQKVPQTANPYTLFESLQVRPLATSPNGKLLFAANTPDNRLEVFKVTDDGLKPVGSVVVGLEPVAVAARTPNEVWVVNHLSDSVSIVNVDDADNPRVVRTLAVGDEPRDIVFAGPGKSRAFITTAHRGQNGQNLYGDSADLHAPSTAEWLGGHKAPSGRADVWVFDANNLGATAAGTRLTKLTLFADTPRALAASADGTRVYAAAYFSGNQTTVVSPDAVRAVFHLAPTANTIVWPGASFPQPLTGLVVHYAGGHWLDFYGNNFDAWVTISLPDNDVFAIDATANPPAALGAYQHVGTTLFNAAVNPVTGKVYVSNTDAHNAIRFEGHNPGVPTVRGNIVDSRISVIDPGSGNVTAVNLNSHLSHTFDGDGAGDATLSRAFPQDLVVSKDGKKLYVVAQGSAKLAIYDTAALESGSATPTAGNQVVLSAGGPTGVVVDEQHGRAYVLTRFDNGISTVDLSSNSETAHLTLYNPEPPNVTAGRRYLYDATLTSKLGDQACASCHIGGDFDGLAWDLGNPGALPLAMLPFDQANDAAQGQAAGDPNVTLFLLSKVFTIPPPVLSQLLHGFTDPLFQAFMPLKGPMTTQSLRGMDNHGAMHWRGDRNGSIQQEGTPVVVNGIPVETTPFLDANGNPVLSAQPGSGIFDELNAFKSFNVAFPGLVGRDSKLDDGDMTDYANFALELTYPPNPIRNLDDSLTAAQKTALDFYTKDDSDRNNAADRFHTCGGCHVLDRNGNAGLTKHPGFFGTDGKLSFENEPQVFKVAHLRNLYQKIGMWGSAPDGNFPGSELPLLNPGVVAPVPSVRGFGFQHDGCTGPAEHFFTAQVFVKATENVLFQGALPVGPNPGGISFLLTDPPDHPQTGTPIVDPTFGPVPDPNGVELRHDLAELMFAFDTNMRPIVGHQTTLTHDNAASAAGDITLLETQAALGYCDLVVKGRVFGVEAGFVWSNGAYHASTARLPPLSDSQLRALVGTLTDALTFTAVPPGSGWRIGVDRDGDGWADLDEVAAGKSPTDPGSHP